PGLCLLGIAIGVMTGMLGIGGGVLFVPLLVLVAGLTAHQAVGTSLGVVLFGAIAGTIKYGLDGSVNLWIVMALLVSSVFGVQLGAHICQRLHAKRLRFYFAVMVLMIAVLLASDFAVKLTKS
ncbi:MAG: sulfite exporter TauE/SafE family protein, partial [Phycisphaerae bacterium]|nr:sulfite exporter TauE/SafE family protein [Phycisphaerae bacterium]